LCQNENGLANVGDVNHVQKHTGYTYPKCSEMSVRAREKQSKAWKSARGKVMGSELLGGVQQKGVVEHCAEFCVWGAALCGGVRGGVWAQILNFILRGLRYKRQGRRLRWYQLNMCSGIEENHVVT